MAVTRPEGGVTLIYPDGEREDTNFGSVEEFKEAVFPPPPEVQASPVQTDDRSGLGRFGRRVGENVVGFPRGIYDAFVNFPQNARVTYDRLKIGLERLKNEWLGAFADSGGWPGLESSEAPAECSRTWSSVYSPGFPKTPTPATRRR